jgi:hypothetical protein
VESSEMYESQTLKIVDSSNHDNDNNNVNSNDYSDDKVIDNCYDIYASKVTNKNFQAIIDDNNDDNNHDNNKVYVNNGDNDNNVNINDSNYEVHSKENSDLKLIDMKWDKSQVYMHIYIYTCIYTYIYIYMY